MSTWTREDGEIKLPSAEFARVRQEVADAITKRSDAIYEKAQEFWKGLTPAQKADPQKYRAALNAFEARHVRTRYGYGGVYAGQASTLPEGFADAVSEYQYWEGKKPTRLQKKDLPYPTNRDLKFHEMAESWELTFDRQKNTVKWYVEEGNDAVHRSRESTAGTAFFQALQKVKWTRGTGGIITGNNEHNVEARGDGFGANYTSDGFGPIGAATAPWQTEPYVMADGTRVTRNDFEKVAKAHWAAEKRARDKQAAASITQGRVGRGVPAGGQYTGRNRAEYGSALRF